MNDTGGPAYPAQEKIDYPSLSVMEYHTGMTMRDYFAAKAMQAIMSTVKHEDDKGRLFMMSLEWYEQHAYHAYSVADAMLKARN